MTYGYRRITKMLQYEGWQVNHKRIYHPMDEMGLLQTRKWRKVRNHKQPARLRLLSESCAVCGHQPNGSSWVADITYMQLGRVHVYLAVVMGVFTRVIRGWQLSRNLDAESLTISALKKALKTYYPAIHHLLGLCQSVT